MTTKVVTVIKYLGIFIVLVFSTISCEKDIESIGVSLIDNNIFTSKKTAYEVLTSTQNIERVPTNGAGQYLLGVYADNEFGSLKASIVTQLNVPVIGTNYTYGTNAGIDSVIVSIPYQVTKKDKLTDGKPQFSIDSIIGDTNTEFKLNVYELNTFLNTLDPNDPTKFAIYYSDKQFQKGPTPLYSGNFKVNPNDTVSYIKRYLADGITVYKKDTIKNTDKSPSIKLPLNETLIKQLFIDNASSSNFASTESFQSYFRGLYIEASVLNSEKSHLLSLNISNAKMTIYYSNNADETADEDLNGNGTKGEQNVRVKRSYDFLFGTIKANVFERNYSNSKQSGAERLYVQGAAGSLATIDLFNGVDLTAIQNANRLITEANLTFYVDQNASSAIVPEQLILFNYDEKVHILDVMTEGLSKVSGKLVKDADGKPYKYVFKITDYISELLKSKDPINLVRLGLKVYNPSDLPVDVTDTKVKENSWTPKGVVLFGHHASAGDKKLKLEVLYSEINIKN
ncbi:DUF4270 domain-containing protein [Lutibacter sp.]|uniref:DUF4270 domain-containing protein n=1 Tax=Lutibacter sp. TaxID=1925666 RepID=UPI002732C2CE|nr:DUF4270 domain-containing protein [Lutibacter sp.]MDP3313828.1 DUF4270 domain-containing protein [Lutibacter sp.]